MIHRRKGRKLKRTASHRSALLSNLSVSLIKNKKISTTLAKARELRTYVENLITKSRKAIQQKSNPEKVIHLKRVVNRYLKDKGAVKTLFDEIAPKSIDRPGGYTRVLKLGRRYGDAAELALIELVDYNIEQTESRESGKKPVKGKLLKSIRKRKQKKEKETSETPETASQT